MMRIPMEAGILSALARPDHQNAFGTMIFTCYLAEPTSALAMLGLSSWSPVRQLAFLNSRFSVEGAGRRPSKSSDPTGASRLPPLGRRQPPQRRRRGQLPHHPRSSRPGDRWVPAPTGTPAATPAINPLTRHARPRPRFAGATAAGRKDLELPPRYSAPVWTE